VKILNKDAAAHEFVIAASGLPGLQVDYGMSTVAVGPGDVQSVPVRVRLPRAGLSGGADIQVPIETADDMALRAVGRARFLAPTN
jgi:hypothetical protein